MKDRIEFKSDFGVVPGPALEKPVYNLLGLACIAIIIFGSHVLWAIVGWFTSEPGFALIGMAFVEVVLGAAGLFFACFSIDRGERWMWVAYLQIFAIVLIPVFWFWHYL